MPFTVSDDYLSPPEDNFVGGLGGDNAGDNNLGGGLPTGGGGFDPGAGAPPAPDLNDQMANDAKRTAALAGSYNPGDLVAANQGPGTIPNLGEPPRVLSGAEPQTFIKRLDDSGGLPTSPSAPVDVVTGTTPGVTSGLPTSGAHQLSDADWQKTFQDQMGYYNPQFESRQAFLDEALRGDQAIRGNQVGGPHIDELARMAQFDSDAKRLYDKIQANPDYYRSQNAATWALEHNQDLANQAQQLTGVTSQQVGAQGFNGKLGAPSQAAPRTVDTAYLRGQIVNEITNPIDNMKALLSSDERAKLTNDLLALGATDPKVVFDSRGNWGLTYRNKSGGLEGPYNGTWIDSGDLGAMLDKRVAAMQAAAPPTGGGGGGGYSGGGYRAPRGGGGGGGAPKTPNNPYAAEVSAYDTSVTPITGIRGEPLGDNRYGPGAAFGTNIAGTTVGGPYANQTAPLYDEFGQPYGRRYGQTGIGPY